ncbi:MAG: leucine-rich repeat domain-containing protein, partial [Oscillospiraceae bacterium]|nr:leucine-rich repeat domain-containing protein [Oscillospiraceae bacterium]
QFVYEIHADGTAIILDFTGSDTELVITSQIGGYPVTEIGQYAFEAAWDVTSITLPDTIQIINEQAFADCEMLSEINIPDSVTAIGRGAFSNCMNLTELTIPASVTETGEEMLTNCLNLQDLSILNPALSCDNWGLGEIEFESGTPCVIHAPADSEVLNWAEENNFPTEASN